MATNAALKVVSVPTVAQIVTCASETSCSSELSNEEIMTEVDIKVGQTYSGKRWKSDRKVVRFERVKDLVVVHYIDLRTSRTGNAPLELFAASTDRHGLVANV